MIIRVSAEQGISTSDFGVALGGFPMQVSSVTVEQSSGDYIITVQDPPNQLQDSMEDGAVIENGVATVDVMVTAGAKSTMPSLSFVTPPALRSAAFDDNGCGIRYDRMFQNALRCFALQSDQVLWDATE